MIMKHLSVALVAAAILTGCGGEKSGGGNNTITHPPSSTAQSSATSSVAPGSSASSSSEAPINLNAGLAAHYAFDGDFTDSTGNLADATITGDRPNLTVGQITFSSGLVGGAAAFDGTSGLRLPDGLIDSNTYSVSLWVNPDVLVNFTSVFFGDDLTGNWLSVIPQGPDTLPGFSGDETMVRAVKSEVWFEGGTGVLINTGEWSHLAFTVNNGQIDIYIDGVNRRSYANFPDLFSNVAAENGGLFTVGINWWDDAFTGLIDELRIYDRALSAQEVVALANHEVEHSSSSAAASSSSEPAASSDPATSSEAAVSSDASSSSESAVDITTGLTAHYAFEDNLVDTTENFAAGSIVGDRIESPDVGAITFSAGAFEDSLAAYFDGSSGVRLPDGLISSHNYTVSMWLNPEQLVPFTAAFFGAANVDNWLSVVPSFGVEENQGDAWVWSRTDIDGVEDYLGFTGIWLQTGQWAHVAFTVNAGTTTVYVNGEARNNAGAMPNIFGAGNAIFGLGVNYWNDPFQGLIDDLRVYDRALTAEQVQALANPQ